MHIIVNGEAHEHKGNGSIDALLQEFGAHKAHTALMLNGDFISSDNWRTAAFHENDEIEIVVFVGGG